MAQVHGAAAAHAPSAPHAPTVKHVEGWTISSSKGGMLTTHETDEWQHSLGLPELPEMVFGGNVVRFDHAPSGFRFEINTRDALARVRTELDSIKVAASEKWMETCNVAKAKDVVAPFDWTFTTDYRGTVLRRLPASEAFVNDDASVALSAEHAIDLDLLRRRDPILFYEENILFEDELADHGEACLQVKVRVMPSCFFALLRFDLRVDGVLNRVLDTRVFHRFGTDVVLREHRHKERMTADIAAELGPAVATPVFFADTERVLPHLDTRAEFVEVVRLSSSASS